MEFALIVTLALVVLLLTALLYMYRRLGATQDALARAKRASGQEMAKQQAWTEAIAGSTSLGLVALNSRRRIVFMNAAARALFGTADGIGKPIGEIAWGFDLQPSVDYILAQRDEFMYQTVMRGEHAFAVTLRRIGQGSDTGVLIELNETTELQRLGRARREFVANISHELRTPITSLQLLVDTMTENRLSDQGFVRDLVGKIRIQIDLLRQLTEELMDLALIESGQAPIKLVEMNADELARQVTDALRPQAERKGLDLRVSVPADLVVLADVQAIRKVLGNLVHNAIKFTPAGGWIEVRAVPKNDNVEFAVEDSGIGIPAGDLPRVFERFYKVDRSRARANGELHGTGLGLAIAKHVITAHGGSIWATSVEGHGATFFFTLPAAG